MDALTCLFAVLSSKKLQYVELYLQPEIAQDPTSDELRKLQKNFGQFLKSQQDPELYHLYLGFDFTYSKAASLGIKCFGFVTQFILENKKELEGYEEFVVGINGFYVCIFC